MMYDTPQIVDSQRILYTASSFARSSLLHLQEVGSLTALAPHTSSRDNLPSYLFFIVTSGSGSLVYYGKEYEMGAGDCVFIDCSNAYSHSTPATQLSKESNENDKTEAETKDNKDRDIPHNERERKTAEIRKNFKS